MANLTPTPGWDDVPQLDTTTPVLGGPGGPANAQAQALLNRLEALRGTGSGQGASQIGVQDALGLLTATNVEAALAEIATRIYGDVTFVATGSDDSTTLQTFIDANKGKHIIVRGDCTFAGVTLIGSSYNGTRLDVQSHKLKVRPTSATDTFGGAYVGLLFKDCDACELTYRGDGQRALQPDEQHIYLVGLAGVSNLHIVKFHCREIRGDGLYVSQSSWTSSSTTTTNLVIDDIKGYNSADDGRNLLSLIAYDGVAIGSFQSIAIGGVVGGVRMPGGLDVEPNFAYQTCNSLTIGSAVVRSQGTTCFGVQGKDAGSEAYCVTGFSCGSLDSINTLGTSATTGTWAFNFYQATDVQITGRVGHTVNTHGLTGRIDACIGVQAKLKVSKSFAGIALGESGWVRKSHIDINITEYAGAAAGYGVRLVGLSDCRVTGHVSGAQNAGSTFAVQFRNNSRAITQTNNRISIDAPKDTNNARGYRNETADLMVFSNCQISDCNVTGYGSWNAGMDGFGVAGIRKVRIFGWTVVSSQPSDGGWTQGDFVEKTNPTKDASNMAVYGWVRITTGTGAVSGTDWSIANVSHVSPAT